MESIKQDGQIINAWHQLFLDSSELYNRLQTGIRENWKDMLVMAASSQEASQQSALRLWDASTGLNSASLGALNAMANQGTRTQTTKQSSSGFFGGLFGGVASAFAGGFGMGYGSRV